jgi:hypothetical protein
MKVAVLGAAASALLGGTLAVTPLSSVSTPLPPAGAQCVSGCGKVASVLVPETPRPSGSTGAPAAQVGGPHAPSPAAANLTAPGVARQPGGGPSAARAGSTGAGSGGAPAADLPGLGGVPDVAGMPDVGSLAPGMAGLTSVPADAQAIQSVWGTIVAVPSSLVGLAGSATGVAASASLALFYLDAAGLLPKNLSVPGLNFPSIPGLGLSSIPGLSSLPVIPGLTVPNAAAAVPEAVAAIPGAAVAIPAVASALPAMSLPGVGLPAVGLPAVGLPAVGLPGVGLPAAPALPPLPALPARLPGLPAAPALPRLPAAPALPRLPAAPQLPPLPRLPAPPALPAPPHLPGPGAILHKRCTPHLGPIGLCIP